MASWNGKKEIRHSDQEEFDIENIDPAVFDDPVLLLEYLEKQELLNKKSSASNSSTIKQTQKSASKPSNNHVIGSNVIYGYDFIRGEIRINPVQAAAVADIISLYEAGYNYTQIVALLSKSKHRTVTGKKFYLSAVYTIIKNKRVYEGETGYPPILKSNNRNIQEQKKITVYQSNANSTNSLTQNAVNSRHTSPYLEAIERMRRSIELREKVKTQKQEVSEKKIYHNIDDFLTFIKSKGIPVKDNRPNDGCVWVRADAEIADIMAHVVIKGRGFRYSPKCRAFSGGPGWYY